MTVTNLTLPTISGTPNVGQTLHADPGTWSYDLDTISYAYQWRRCDGAGASCADISGQTGSSYTLTTADAASTIRVRVTATEAAAPPPADVDPYWEWKGATQAYVPLSTVFEATTVDSHVQSWGGLSASSYDTVVGDNAIIMARDPAQRVSLRTSPSPPHAGHVYVSRQELRTTDGPWYPGAGANYDKSTIRNLENDTFNGNFAFGVTRWFAWDYYLPNSGGDVFNWALSGWHTLMDLHGSGYNYQQSWNVLEAQVRPIATNNAYIAFHMGAHEGSSDPAPPDLEFVNLLRLSDGAGARISGSFNVWHELVVGVKFASDGVINSSTGWIDIWHDGVNVLPQHQRPTCFPNESSIWMQAQNYKQHGSSLYGGATSSVIVFGGLRAGLTRDDVMYG